MSTNLKKELSDDAKIARIKTWAAKLGLNEKETCAALTEKYGPFAYDVMCAVMMNPAATVKQVGGQVRTSKEAADYFIKHHIPAADLAKMLGKNAQTVESEIAAYNKAHPKAEETAEQKEIRERQEEFNSHFNDEMNRNREVAEITVDPAKVDINKMTLEDYAKYCRPQDRPANGYADLAEKAYNDFGKGEGKIENLYLDGKGNPTIGNGHLVLLANSVNDQKHVNGCRESYVQMPLLGTDGKPLTAAQKRVQFNQILDAVKRKTIRSTGGCPNTVTSPRTGNLDKAGIKKVFLSDFEYAYRKTKEVVKNIDNMPLPVQLAVLHTTFAYGNAERLRRVDLNSPAAVMKKVDQLRNCKGTSKGERDTIREANDSIRVAQDNYRKEIAYKSAQNNINNSNKGFHLNVSVKKPNPSEVRVAMAAQKGGR